MWNAVETLIGAWAKDLEESLETNTEPNWDALAGDLEVAQAMVYKLASRVPNGLRDPRARGES